MSGSIVMASFGDGLPRGIQSILLQYDTTRRSHRNCARVTTRNVDSMRCATSEIAASHGLAFDVAHHSGVTDGRRAQAPRPGPCPVRPGIARGYPSPLSLRFGPTARLARLVQRRPGVLRTPRDDRRSPQHAGTVRPALRG